MKQHSLPEDARNFSSTRFAVSLSFLSSIASNLVLDTGIAGPSTSSIGLNVAKLKAVWPEPRLGIIVHDVGKSTAVSCSSTIRFREFPRTHVSFNNFMVYSLSLELTWYTCDVFVVTIKYHDTDKRWFCHWYGGSLGENS